MTELDLSIRFLLPVVDRATRPKAQKKADVVENPEVLHYVGLLVNEPPGIAGLPFS
jgi:hypothetical protein